MTDNEIIKALEHCKVGGVCTNCPLFECKSGNCIAQLNVAALDLIKRQQAEIEMLKSNNGVTQHLLSEAWESIEEKDKWVEKREQIAKSEAITEFAERLKTTFKQMEYTANIKRKTVTVDELICQANWIIREASIDVIDELLSEMTEGDNGA